MQVRQAPAKPKYKLSDFIMAGNSKAHELLFTPNDSSCTLSCICKSFSKITCIQCSRCSSYIHRCLLKDRGNKGWECLHCQSIYMDPVYSVNQVLLETMFRT